MLNAMRDWSEVTVTWGAGGRRRAYSTDPDQESFSEEVTFALTPKKKQQPKNPKQKQTGKQQQ